MALRQKGLWVVCMVAAVLTVVDLPTSWGVRVSRAQAWSFFLLFGMTKGTVLWLLLSPLRINAVCRAVRGVILAVYLLVGLINVTGLVCYGFGINYRFISIIGNSTWAEVRQFWPYLMANLSGIPTSPMLWVGCGVLVAAFVMVRRVPSRMFFPVVAVGSVMGLFTYGMMSHDLRRDRSMAIMCVRIPRLIMGEVESQRVLQEFVDRMTPLPPGNDVRSEALAENVVVVIGESANRDHHSLYGCPIRTTPRLDARREELFAFRQALAPATTTLPSIERILTFKKDDRQDGNWVEYPNIIDLFNKAGYRTYWLSNQNKGGVCMDASAAIATHATRSEYVGNTYYESQQLYYDERLLPSLDRAMADSKGERKLIFLHLMGSHTDYRLRYPDGRGVVDAEDVTAVYSHPWLTPAKAKVLAEYLSSIRYTDSILDQVVTRVKASPLPTVMIYLSDHGEAVYDEDDFVGRDLKHVAVPFILYMNDAYRRRNPEMVRMVEAALDRPFSTANIIHSILTLTGTEYPLYEPEEDVLSPKFRPRKRYVDKALWPYEEKALPVGQGGMARARCIAPLPDPGW